MGTLVFVCPATGEEVSTGIEMYSATLARLRLADVHCLHCQVPHRMSDVTAWVAGDEVSEMLPMMAGVAAFR